MHMNLVGCFVRACAVAYSCNYNHNCHFNFVNMHLDYFANVLQVPAFNEIFLNT